MRRISRLRERKAATHTVPRGSVTSISWQEGAWGNLGWSFAEIAPGSPLCANDLHCRPHRPGPYGTSPIGEDRRRGYRCAYAGDAARNQRFHLFHAVASASHSIGTAARVRAAGDYFMKDADPSLCDQARLPALRPRFQPGRISVSASLLQESPPSPSHSA